MAGALNVRNDLQVDSVHNLSINSNAQVFCKGNAGCTGKWTGPFQLLDIVNETCKISLPSGPTNFRSIMVKPYLIKPEDDNPNDTLRTKYNDQKNGHQEDHHLIVGPIIIDSILTIVVMPPVAVNLLIDLLDDYNCEVVSPSQAGENFN